MRWGSAGRLGTAFVPALVVAVSGLGAAGRALADEPVVEPIDVTEPVAVGEVDGTEVALTDPVVPPTDAPSATHVPPAIGVVDGVEVAVGEAPVPVAPATVDAPAEWVAVAVVDGVEVAVVAPPVPTTPPPASVTPSAPSAPAAAQPASAPRAAAQSTVALVLAAWS